MKTFQVQEGWRNFSGQAALATRTPGEHGATARKGDEHQEQGECGHIAKTLLLFLKFLQNFDSSEQKK